MDSGRKSMDWSTGWADFLRGALGRILCQPMDTRTPCESWAAWAVWATPIRVQQVENARICGRFHPMAVLQRTHLDWWWHVDQVAKLQRPNVTGLKLQSEACALHNREEVPLRHVKTAWVQPRLYLILYVDNFERFNKF